MKPNTILWHPTRQFHYCVMDGDSVVYTEDAEGRNVAQCVACEAKLVVVRTART